MDEEDADPFVSTSFAQLKSDVFGDHFSRSTVELNVFSRSTTVSFDDGLEPLVEAYHDGRFADAFRELQRVEQEGDPATILGTDALERIRRIWPMYLENEALLNREISSFQISMKAKERNLEYGLSIEGNQVSSCRNEATACGQPRSGRLWAAEKRSPVGSCEEAPPT